MSTLTQLLQHVRDRANVARDHPVLCELFGGLVVYEATRNRWIEKDRHQKPDTCYMRITKAGDAKLTSAGSDRPPGSLQSSGSPDR